MFRTPHLMAPPIPPPKKKEKMKNKEILLKIKANLDVQESFNLGGVQIIKY